MTVTCIVCKGKAEGRSELMFHKFPNNEQLRQIWIQNMGIDREVAKSSRLCSIHFSQKCFKPAFYTGNPRLIEGAIPTIKTLEEFIELETVSTNVDEDNHELDENFESIDTENFECVDYNNVESIKTENAQANQDNNCENNEQIEQIQEKGMSNDFDNIEEFSPDESSEPEHKKTVREIQYASRRLTVRTMSPETFNNLPDQQKLVYFLEAKQVIDKLDLKVTSLQRSNNNYKRKTENLQTFVKNMKDEIKKRNKKAKIEW